MPGPVYRDPSPIDFRIRPVLSSAELTTIFSVRGKTHCSSAVGPYIDGRGTSFSRR